jgi:hypothetical protein
VDPVTVVITFTLIFECNENTYIDTGAKNGPTVSSPDDKKNGDTLDYVLARNPEYSESKLLQRNFVHHKSYIN